MCLESRDRPREGRTGRVLIAEGQTAGYRHSQRPLGCTSREREDESAAELEGRKRLPSPVDWPKMNEGACTGPENETRRKGLSAACCWMRSSAFSGERLDACKFGRASFEVLVSFVPANRGNVIINILYSLYTRSQDPPICGRSLLKFFPLSRIVVTSCASLGSSLLAYYSYLMT